MKLSRSTIDALFQAAETRYCAPPPCLYEDEATGFSSDEDYYDEYAPPAVSYSAGRKWELCKYMFENVTKMQVPLGAKFIISHVGRHFIALKCLQSVAIHS